MREREPILSIRDLRVQFDLDYRTVFAVNGVSIRLASGEAIGIVGESGCGKSVTAHSVLGLLPKTARIAAGRIAYQSKNGKLLDLGRLKPTGKTMRSIRGADIAMIFQEPMTSLSPVHTIGSQITDVMLLHTQMSRRETRERAVELLGSVGVPRARQRIDEYTFQYSGGMRQRAMIAMALACKPRILIADEPTTALDVTIQAQVLQLIKEIQGKEGISLILITHDLGVIAQMVEYVYVMYLGTIVEEGPVEDIFDDPRHPYTRDLLRSIPRMDDMEELYAIEGAVPSDIPSGCPFHTRCSSYVGKICEEKSPPSIRVGNEHFVRCFLYGADAVHRADDPV